MATDAPPGSPNLPWISNDVLNGSPSHRIPLLLDSQIAKFRENLMQIPNFDPNTKFDPAVHLLDPRSKNKSGGNGSGGHVKTITLTELGITNSATPVPPISDVAATAPFPLFSPLAIAIMKWEAFAPQALQNYARRSGNAALPTATDFHICGYIHHAPFTKAAWSHPQTTALISELAGVDLRLMFDYEISHVNVNLQDEARPAAAAVRDDTTAASVYDWHFDSNSFVVVLMLSAPEGMVGGATGLENGAGSVVYVEGPREGYATVLQGRVVRHIATKPLTNHERISAVAGYVPASVAVPDTTVLTSFRPLVMPRSIHDEYYREWCEYRFERLERMVRLGRERMAAGEFGGRCARDGPAGDTGRHFDQKAVVEWCDAVREYLDQSYHEFEYYTWRASR